MGREVKTLGFLKLKNFKYRKGVTFNMKANRILLSAITLIAFTSIVVFWGYSKNKSTLLSLDEFLNNNISSLNIADDDDFSSFKLLDKDMTKDVFLVGESHGTVANEELGLKFLKYFQKQAGVKYYLIELPYSTGYFLNQYLITGDESILNGFSGGYWSKQTSDKWRKIYEFNKTLPEDKKIKVVGIDIEQGPISGLACISTLIPKNDPPSKIASFISNVRSCYKLYKTDSEIKQFATDLKKDIENNEDIYKQYLKDNYFEFQFVINNILNYYELNNEESYKNGNSQIRDDKMFENFSKVYKRLPPGKFFGQFGLLHILQNKTGDNKLPLAAQMNGNTSPVKNKVLSIVCLYKGCHTMGDGGYSIFNLSTYDPKLDKYVKKGNTLLKLKGERSPYQKKLIWNLTRVPGFDDPHDGVTTDYYQYLLIIENSQAATIK